jgi:hypothetical protein
VLKSILNISGKRAMTTDNKESRSILISVLLDNYTCHLRADCELGRVLADCAKVHNDISRDLRLWINEGL